MALKNLTTDQLARLISWSRAGGYSPGSANKSGGNGASGAIIIAEYA